MGLDVRVPIVEFCEREIVELGANGSASVVCLHQVGCRAVRGPVDANAAGGGAGVLCA